MSGQSLTDVVSHVIQSMLDTPHTLMDELLYVYQVDQTLPMDVSINEIYWLSDPHVFLSNTASIYTFDTTVSKSLATPVSTTTVVCAVDHSSNFPHTLLVRTLLVPL